MRGEDGGGSLSLRALMNVFLHPVMTTSFTYTVSVAVVALSLTTAYHGPQLLFRAVTVTAYYTLGLVIGTLVFGVMRVPGSFIEYIVSAIGAQRFIVYAASCSAAASALASASTIPIVVVLALSGGYTVSPLEALLWVSAAASAAATVTLLYGLTSSPPSATLILLLLALPALMKLIGGKTLVYAERTVTFAALASPAVSLAALAAAGEERARRSLLRLALQYALG